MPSRFQRVAAMVVAVACLCAQAWAGSAWRLTRTEHFVLYSQSDDGARALLKRFEQLRAFFLEQSIVPLDVLPPVRLIVFGSQKEFEPYRLRATSDAYYVGTESRDYIVMPAGG